jgi:hypothetical protein
MSGFPSPRDAPAQRGKDGADDRIDVLHCSGTKKHSGRIPCKSRFTAGAKTITSRSRRRFADAERQTQAGDAHQ